MSKLSFLREGLRHLRTTGTVFRSGPALCRAAVDRIDYTEAKMIVELGAGDGVISRYILDRMAPDARLLAFELNDQLCEQLRTLNDDRLVVAEASAEELPQWLEKLNCSEVDAVVCSLPFASLPAQVGQNILNAAHRYLRPNGPYNQVHYSLKRMPWYQKTFKTVQKQRVWKNMPPAWVLYCRK